MSEFRPGDRAVVRAALDDAQRLGFLGERPVDEVIEHSQGFVVAVRAWANRAGRTPVVVDLGSGGGVPGLVIAADVAEVSLNLVDRRGKRTDFLERVVRRLGWNDRVRVVHADVNHLVSSPSWREQADVVTARGFGPPDVTLTAASRLVRPGGWIVISEPPPGSEERWSPELLLRCGLHRVRLSPTGDTSAGGARVAVFERPS